MKTGSRTLAFFSAIAVLGALGCANLTSGGGSEWEAKITGRISDTLGNPLQGVRVQLLPALYNPCEDAPLPDSFTKITDNAGRYMLAISGSPGTYNIEAEHPVLQTRALITGIAVAGSDTVFAPQAAVRRTGYLRVELPSADTADGYAYLPGTPLFSRVRGFRAFIENVPAGFIPAVYYAEKGDSAAPRVIATNVTVRSGDTAVISDYSSWTYSKRLTLNTTVSGAAVAGTVTNFPVLVRLNSGNFSFSQAAGRGDDLCFSKSDGTMLNHELERYDSSAGQAEVWVLTDTVYGNNGTQSIIMRWGASTGTISNSSAVFDAAIGFQGVWHLGEAGGSTAQDASGNRYHGVASAVTAAAGAIGIARKFDGSSSFITMPNTAAGRLDFPENGHYALSAWVKADTLDGGWHEIAGKGHEQYYLKLAYVNKFEFVEYQESNGWLYSQGDQSNVAGQWYLVTGVRNGTRQALYVNGVCVDTAIQVSTDSLLPRTTADDFTIGRYLRSFGREGFAFFKGTIDETRIESIARSSDWVKLCYMNQKAVDALVQFK
jgi:hypothetical protein